MIGRTFWGVVVALAIIGSQPAGNVKGAPAAAEKKAGLEVVSAEGNVPEFVPGRVLVKFKPGVGQTRRQSILAAKHAREGGGIPGIGVRIIELPENANEKAHLAAFRGRREVEFAELDHVYEPALVPNDPWYDHWITPEWHLPQIGCPAAWDITTGSSDLIIAILDSGVYGDHEDIGASKMVPGWNIYDDNDDTSDVKGHGTTVAGIAGAISDNGIGVASVAWGCKIMPIRVSDIYGWSSSSRLTSGLVWAADHGALVANMSFEGFDNPTLTSGAQYFQDKGGVVVQSAGNSGIFDSTPDNAYILKISGTNSSDLVSSWSVTGNNIDLAAPAVNIPTTTFDGGYGNATGTSCSAPIVAGVAALVLSANPSLTGAEVQEILKQSADDLGAPGWDTEYGWGRVNAGAAVSLALDYGGTTDTEPPTVSFDSPQEAEIVSGGIDVQVSAADDVGVASVSLSVDGSPLATDSTAPYAFFWDTTEAANGSQALTATATDAAGNTASSDITVTVDNFVPDTTAPTVSIDWPADGTTVNGTVTVQASASDDVGVASVAFRVDGDLLGSDASAPYTVSWDTVTASNGSHILTATALDASGNASDAEVSVTVDNPVPDTTPPTVDITAPENGESVSGTVAVTVSAADDYGVDRVVYQVDGTEAATVTASPWSWQWDSSTVDDGPHALVAVAYDLANNSGQSFVSVEVSNSTPDPDPTPVTESFEGSVNKRNPEQTFDIIVGGSGTLDAEVTFGGRKSTLECSLIDPSGNVIAGAAGDSPLRLASVAVTPGTYTVRVARISKNVGFTVTVTHP